MLSLEKMLQLLFFLSPSSVATLNSFIKLQHSKRVKIPRNATCAWRGRWIKYSFVQYLKTLLTPMLQSCLIKNWFSFTGNMDKKDKQMLYKNHYLVFHANEKGVPEMLTWLFSLSWQSARKFFKSVKKPQEDISLIFTAHFNLSDAIKGIRINMEKWKAHARRWCAYSSSLQLH